MAKGFDGNASNYLSSDTLPVSVFPFFISCTFRLNSLGPTQTLVYWGDKDQGDEEDCVMLRFIGNDASSDKNQIQIFTESEGFVRETTSGLGNTYTTAGVWASATGFAQSGNRHATLDGSGTFSAGGDPRDPVDPDRFAIGVQANTSLVPGPLDGDIAEVAIWSGDGLGDIPTTSLRYFSPLLVRPSNLVFYAPLIAGKDYDQVGGINLTTNGTLTDADHPVVRRPHY